MVSSVASIDASGVSGGGGHGGAMCESSDASGHSSRQSSQQPPPSPLWSQGSPHVHDEPSSNCIVVTARRGGHARTGRAERSSSVAAAPCAAVSASGAWSSVRPPAALVSSLTACGIGMPAGVPTDGAPRLASPRQRADECPSCDTSNRVRRRRWWWQRRLCACWGGEGGYAGVPIAVRPGARPRSSYPSTRPTSGSHPSRCSDPPAIQPPRSRRDCGLHRGSRWRYRVCHLAVSARALRANMCGDRKTAFILLAVSTVGPPAYGAPRRSQYAAGSPSLCGHHIHRRLVCTAVRLNGEFHSAVWTNASSCHVAGAPVRGGL